MKKIFLLAVLLFAAVSGVPAGAASGGLSAEEIVARIYDKFMGWNFKTMTYDELRVSSMKMAQDKVGGASMPLNESNATIMKLRYFFKAPDNHGYKLLSDPIDNYWVGSPNQPGAIPMDSHWKEKISTWYSVSKTEKNQVYRDRECYVVTLVPRENTPAHYPMTWYVDTASFNVLKFIFLLQSNNKKMTTTGEVYYGKVNNYELPVEAHWKTKISMLPYIFLSDSIFSNHSFNVPLDDSVFKEEFPEDWFKKLGEIPEDGPSGQ